MKRFQNNFIPTCAIAALLAGFAGVVCAGAAIAADTSRPASLIITGDPLPPNLLDKLNAAPDGATVTLPANTAKPEDKIAEYKTLPAIPLDQFDRDLQALDSRIAGLSDKLTALEQKAEQNAAAYYTNVAAISAELQSGTAPDDARLHRKLSDATASLDQFALNVAAFNDLSVALSSAAADGTALLAAAGAANSAPDTGSGDQARLAKILESARNSSALIARIQSDANDDLTRATAYLSTERDNLRTLSSIMSSGGGTPDKGLLSRIFSYAKLASFSENAPAPTETEPAADGAQGAAPSGAPAPLVKIRFDRSEVDYRQPMYMAVNEALSRYPDARFELVAIHPGNGNAAQVAIESAKSRRNAERVLRSLTEMGLDLDRIDLSYTPSAEVTTNEVRLYVQ